MSRKLIFMFTTLLLAISALGCSFNNPPTAEEGVVDYYTKELVLSTWVDEEKTWWDEVETRLYNEFGVLTVVSKHTYEPMAEPGYEYFMITRTDIYEVDDEGNQELVEYYIYTYHPDYYQYIDDDDIEVDEVDYLLLRGEARSSDDVLRYYYDVAYDVAPADGDYTIYNYDYYTSIIDRRSDGESTAEQFADYVTDEFGDKHFRTEKYYVRNEDDSALILSKEFASWYDSEYPFDYLYDLFHSFRGEDGDEEFYYYTLYSRNDSGFVYEQADYDYDPSTIPKIATAGDHTDGTFDNTAAVPTAPPWIDGPLGTFDYNIEFDNIGEKATVLTTEYDEAGNITLDQRWYKGELTEYTTYTYNSFSELTDEQHYTDGGTLLRDRKTIRFRDEVLYGQEYSVKETCVYKYYDYSDTESQIEEEARSIHSRMLRPVDSVVGLDDLQQKHLQYSKLNNNYRK